MSREDFLKVDGYDETFDQLWGREDSDICYRLFHNGIQVRNLWFTALQYHLYHRVIKKSEEDRLDGLQGIKEKFPPPLEIPLLLELCGPLKRKKKRSMRDTVRLSPGETFLSMRSDIV